MAILKRGSQGSDVENVQTLLNRSLKPSPNLKVDGKFGSNTDRAVREFQKTNKLQVDGKVGPNTQQMLTNAGGAGKSNKELPKYQVTFQGKTELLTEQEYKAGVEQLLSEIRRGPALQMKMRVDEARITWDHFNDLNNDQYIVSWLIEATRGVDLPKPSVIKQAEGAYRQVDSALKSKNLKAVHSALKDGEDIVNQTLDVMREYRAGMISGGGNWVTGLTFTKSTAFIAVGIMAVPVAVSAGASALGAGVISGGGTSLLESTSNEVGKAAASDKSPSYGRASWNVLRDTFLGASIGALTKGKLGEKLTEAVAKRVAAKAAGRAFSQKTAAIAIGKYFKGSFQKTLEDAAKDGVKAMKGEEMTLDQFFENVAKNIVAGGAFDYLDDVAKCMSPAITMELPRKVYDTISMVGKKKLSDRQVRDLVTSAIKGPLAKPYSMSLDVAVDKMRGKETPKQVAELAAKAFVKPDTLKKLEAYAQKEYGHR